MTNPNNQLSTNLDPVVNQIAANYKKLRVAEHPDISDHPNSEDRFAYTQALYKLMWNHWETKYDPTLSISEETLIKALAAKTRYPPDSFYFSYSQ